MKIYLNGADDTSESPTGDYTEGEYFGIGWDGWEYGPGAKVSEYYDGVIDSVAVYDTALSATDVAKLWDTGDKSGLHLTTKEYDDQAGLYYFWQRWYDPKDGRFIQRSRMSATMEHPYVYVKNNSPNEVDWAGHISIWDIWDWLKKCLLGKKVVDTAKDGYKAYLGCCDLAKNAKTLDQKQKVKKMLEDQKNNADGEKLFDIIEALRIIDQSIAEEQGGSICTAVGGCVESALKLILDILF
jgi:RHS repeat-associated protein